MRLQPLGPEGIHARIEELRSRIYARLGGPAGSGAPASLDPMPLRGAIGATAQAPLNPFGGSLAVEPENGAPPQMKSLIEQAADEAGVDRVLFEALIGQESGFNPSAVSSKGALGLSQLMPSTAAALGVTDPMDPEQNLRAGARYFAQMMRQFGDVRLALAAYNAGPGKVRRAGGVPAIPETQRHVESVLARAEALRTR